MREIEVGKISKEIKSVAANVTKLLQASKIYPYWKSTTHNIICGQITWQLSWLIIFELPASFLIFPMCVFLAQRYLYNIHQARRFHKQDTKQEQEDVDSEEEEEEEEEWENYNQQGMM